MSTETEAGPSSSSSSNKEQMDAKIQALNMLAQGKRNIICGEITTAMTQFRDACELLSEKFGEMASECAEAYYLYGSTLLDISRMEQDVLGNALEGIDVDADECGGPNNKEQFESPSKADEEKRFAVRMQVVDAMSEDEISNQASLASEKGATSFVGMVKKLKENEQLTTVEEKLESGEKIEEICSSNKVFNQKASSGSNQSVAAVSDKTEQDECLGKDARKDEVLEGTAEEIKSSKDEVVEDITIEGKTSTLEEPCVELEADEEKGEEDTEDGTEEDGEEEDAGEDEEGQEEEEGQEDGEGQGDGEKEKENEEEDDPDDIPNLQLSWEMLELAKIIYTKDPAKESQLKAAEACLKLGEVSLEGEQYQQAINDLQACLDIQKKHLEPYDRAIAETYYNMGLACQMCKELEKAEDVFKSALACLKEKIEKLKVVIKEDPPEEPNKFMKPAARATKEIEEILKILPDIEDKITDCQDEAKEMEKLKMMAKDALGSVFGAISDSSERGFGSSSTSEMGSSKDSFGFESSSTSSGFGSSSTSSSSTTAQKAGDISHLIRKKRKPDEEQTDDVEVKKMKQESGSGDAGSLNGQTEDLKEGRSEAVTAT